MLPVVYLVLLCALLAGLVLLKHPSNDRPWKPDMARPPKAEIIGDALTLHNVRNIRYGAPDTPYEAVWETRRYDLSRVRRLWFVVESFSALTVIAHTLLSFEFDDEREGSEGEGGEYLAFSAEARLQDGEAYDILRGLFGNFELMYSFGDERDFILRRTNYKDHDVYLYPLTLTPGEVRAVLEDILRETNVLSEQPRFYNSLTRNCTNLLGVHANHARPGSFAWWRPAQALPGLSDRLLYRMGWLDSTLPFEALREVHNIRPPAQRYGERYRDDPEVSERMRDGLLEHRKGQG